MTALDARYPDDALTDAAGKAHRPASSARIVSLVPSITELLFDLDLADRLVGRTHYCIHPADKIAEVPSVGGTKKISLSKLRALKPSHVIVNIDENTRETAEAIQELGIELVVTHPITPEDNRVLYRLIGGIFDRGEAAEELVRRLDVALAQARDAAANLPAMLDWPLASQTSRMLALIGWDTVCHDPEIRYPEVRITDELLDRTDLVLFSSEPYSFGDQDLADFADAHSCRREKLMLIDGEYTSWYGSRAIDGLTYLVGIARRVAG